MANTTDFTASRLAATRDVEAQLSSWKWEESAFADPAGTVDFAALHLALLAAQGAAATADVSLDSARGAFDATLATLKKQTQTFVALAKVKFRADSGALRVFGRLKTSGTSRAAILQESLDAAEAWESIAKPYAPTAGLTVTSFKALRASAVTQQGVYSAANVDARQKAEALKRATTEADALAKAWYAAATRIFDENTTEGALIRSQIPTRPPKGQSTGAGTGTGGGTGAGASGGGTQQ